MTVKELIAELQSMPPNADVMLADNGIQGIYIDDARPVGSTVVLSGSVHEKHHSHVNITQQCAKAFKWSRIQ